MFLVPDLMHPMLENKNILLTDWMIVSIPTHKINTHATICIHEITKYRILLTKHSNSLSLLSLYIIQNKISITDEVGTLP